MKTLKELFLNELAAIYDAECRFVWAMPKMAAEATNPDLKTAILSHVQETEHHAKEIENVFESFSTRAWRRTSEATIALLHEGDQISSDFRGYPVMNAALIAMAQKVEHHEIASYGCLHEWAELLGNHDAAHTLHDILDEKKAADHHFSELARAHTNEDALTERPAATATCDVYGHQAGGDD